MRRSVFLILSLSFLSHFGLAQTKWIAYKSHSGNMNHYASALIHPTSDLANHNLGAYPVRIIHNASIDSLIFVSDTAAVMVTSVCNYEIPLVSTDTSSRYPSLWKAGRDTVYHHPLFSQRHQLDSIKAELKSTYNFTNNIDSTAFVGYDNKKKKQKRSEKQKRSQKNTVILPIAPTPPSPPASPAFRLGLLGVLLVPIMLFVAFKLTASQRV